MRAPLAIICVFIPYLALSDQPPKAAPRLVAAEGTLSQESDLHWQVRLPSEKPLVVDGKKLNAIRFTVDSVAQATWCQKYEGKNVEISGEINSIAHETALITPHSMTAGKQGPTPPSEEFRRLITHEPDPNHHAPGQPLYRFPYYLVLLDPPQGCERCYVPLLLFSQPIETIATSKGSATVVEITTYERDSIWEMDGLALLTSVAIEPSSSTIRFRGKTYRYEPVRDADVVHLIEHPMGTIPISRVSLPRSEEPGARINDLIAGFHTIFRIRERWRGSSTLGLSDAKDKTSGTNNSSSESTGGTSELTVFDDGKVEFRFAPGCVNRFNLAEMPKSHVSVESWNWRENCPGSERIEKTFDYTLKPAELARLKQLLGRDEVKQLRDCFCNAAAGIGDYDIEIPRTDSTQKIPVLGFMPEHYELREHPEITYLICEARTIRQGALHDQLPNWCENLPPLK